MRGLPPFLLQGLNGVSSVIVPLTFPYMYTLSKQISFAPERYLRKFPIDALKIDQSFVRQIASAPDDTTIVTAVISMGRSLKLRVVAEGVETLQELKFLQAHECDEAQGYYFSQLVLPEQFARLLKTGVSEAAVFVHR